MLIITHDLNFAKIISDEIIVMYDGQIFEQGCDVLANPLHPYTEGFLESLPENGFKPMKGVAPGPYDVVKGCSFYDRCPYKMEKCNKSIPKLYEINHKKVKCFKYA